MVMVGLSMPVRGAIVVKEYVLPSSYSKTDSQTKKALADLNAMYISRMAIFERSGVWAC